MTEYPTRRAAREAEARESAHRRRAQRGSTQPHRVASQATRPHAAPQHRRTYSKARMAAAGAASMLLLGSVMVAIPATAATTNAQTLYASELLSHSQALTVDTDVAHTGVETTSFQAATMRTPSGAPAITVGGVTNADWAALVLQDASLPVTQNNVTVILQWMDSENSPQSWWLRNNPLNNGLGSGGGGGYGSYANLSIAASYVAEQLDRSLFSGIHDALAADSAPSVTEQAIIDSPWASSHYGYGARFHAVNVPIVAAPASDWG